MSVMLGKHAVVGLIAKRSWKKGALGKIRCAIALGYSPKPESCGRVLASMVNCCPEERFRMVSTWEHSGQ